MSWTYDLNISTDTDKVRLLIGDTDTTQQQLQDEEIAFFLASEANTYRAASRAAATIGSKYARAVDKEVGDLKISYSQRAESYKTLAEQLWLRGAISAVPTAGGVYVTEKDAAAANDTLVQPAIRIGIHDFD